MKYKKKKRVRSPCARVMYTEKWKLGWFPEFPRGGGHVNRKGTGKERDFGFIEKDTHFGSSVCAGENFQAIMRHQREVFQVGRGTLWHGHSW